MLAGETHARRSRWLLLTILFVVALAVRTFRGTQETIANPDVMRYLEQAQGLAHDPLHTLQTEDFHPLHAAMGLSMHRLIGPLFANDRIGWLWSFRIVGILAGSIVTLQIVKLARYFGAPFWASLAAGFIWIVGRRTSVYGADGLSDMLFLSLFAAALLVSLPAMNFRTPYLQWREVLAFLIAGMLSGFSYLTRPEGLAATLILLMTLAIPTVIRPIGKRYDARAFRVFAKRRQAPFATTQAIFALLVGTMIVSLPYMFIIGGLTKKVRTAPPGASAALISPVESAALINFQWQSLPKIGVELGETFGFGPMIILLLAIPLLPRFWGRRRMRLLVLVWAGLWLMVMLWLLNSPSKGYLDGRHTDVLVLLLHALFALALVGWARPMVRWMHLWRSTRSAAWTALPAWRRWPAWPRACAWSAFGISVIPGIVQLQSPPRADKGNLIAAARLIAQTVDSNVVICDGERLVGFYSMHPYERWMGSATFPQLDEIEKIRRKYGGAPVILGKVYMVGKGQTPAESIGPYKAMAKFASETATQNDVYVLYALPALTTGQAQRTDSAGVKAP